MSEENKWAESLGISPEQIREWSVDNKPNQPIPYHLMLKKHLDEESYLHWARQEYGLASLGRSFFVGQHDAELWYAMKIEYQWNPWFLPIKIWDNTLFVGCVQPPAQPLNLSLPVHYVLCPAAGLERLWKFYMGDMGVDINQKTNFTITNASETKVERGPAKIPSATPEVLAALEATPLPEVTPVTTTTPVEIPTTEASSGPVLKSDLLSGLNFGNVQATNGKATPKQKTHEKAVASTQAGTSDFSFDFKNLSLNKPNEAKPAPEPAVAPKVNAPPTGPTPLAADKPPAVPLPNMTAQKPAPAMAPQVPPSPPTPTFSGTVARFELTRPETSAGSAPTPMPITPTAPPAKPSTPPLVPPVSAMKIPAAKPISSGAGGAINIATFQMPPSLEMAKNLEQVIAYTFKEMSALYEKCFFAAYDGPRLVISHWTSNVTVNPSVVADALPTDKPNIFKIAHDTKKPFHGPVSLNDTNKAFFANWNNSQIPAVVTIYPVVAGQSLLGHLIGISNKELDIYAALEAMSGFASALCSKSQNLAA